MMLRFFPTRGEMMEEIRALKAERDRLEAEIASLKRQVSMKRDFSEVAKTFDARQLESHITGAVLDEMRPYLVDAAHSMLRQGFRKAEGWSRPASMDVAHDLALRVYRVQVEIPKRVIQLEVAEL